ncbi:MAG: response regulator [Pseudomonadota bacterium]
MKTALIIEDNENNLELISFILQHNGFQTLAAETGQKGIEKALNERPDFIILDIQLPDMEGTKVLDQIRLAGGEMPVIAMTSYAMTGDREKLLAAGCNGYIEKPIDPERVVVQINAVIGE